MTEMRACEECSRNCRLAHWKNQDLSPSVSRFLKIFIGEDISTILRVPPMFTNTISHLVGKDVKLEDITGAQWTVSLSNYMGVLVFHKGWAKFAADHKLQLGDFLVFHYFNFSLGHFVVHIYPRTLVERIDFANNIHPGKDTMTTVKVVADTTQSQRNATNGLSSRSIDHSSRLARPGRNLINARTNSEMGDGNNGFTDIVKTAADTTLFQGNVTGGVDSRDVGRPPKQLRTRLEMGEGDGVSFRDIGIRSHSKQARTSLETGDGDKGATKGLGSRKVGCVSKQGRTCLEMGDGNNDAIDTEKIAADSTPFQGNATKGGRPSKQARADRNLVNERTNLEIGGGDIRTTDTSEASRDCSSTSFPFESNIETPLDQPSANYGPLQPKSVNEEQPYLNVADTTLSQRNATNGVSSISVDHRPRQEMPSINLINARTNLEMGDGNNGAIDTEKFAADTSPFQGNATKGVCFGNFETPLIQPSTSYGPLQPKSGNEEQPCLDDASCVIIDRSTCYAAEKKVVSYDLSVYERQNREPISDKTCIDGDEGTHTHAQKFEASMAEANNSGTGYINPMTVSKVHKTGMVQDMKAYGHMESTGMVQDMKASGHMDTTGNCSKSPLGRGNCSKSPLVNGFAPPIPRQVYTKDTRNEMKVVKKEQVTFREKASDHIRKPQDLNPSWTWAEAPSTSSLKRKAAKLEPEDSLDEPALFPDSITCSAGTDNCDYIKLPARLPSVAFKKGKGRIDNRCSILLIDPQKRKWPAIYLDKFGSFFGVICGWKQFNEANKVLPGDSYVFSLDNKAECRFKVDVVRT